LLSLRLLLLLFMFQPPRLLLALALYSMAVVATNISHCPTNWTELRNAVGNAPTNINPDDPIITTELYVSASSFSFSDYDRGATVGYGTGGTFWHYYACHIIIHVEDQGIWDIAAGPRDCNTYTKYTSIKDLVCSFFYVSQYSTLEISGALTLKGSKKSAFSVKHRATLKLNGTTVANCNADRAGGAINADGSVIYQSNRLPLNWAMVEPLNWAKVETFNVTFSHNTAKDNGGAVALAGGATLNMTDTAVVECFSSNNGGAISADGTGGRSSVETFNVVFSGNRAIGNGGAVALTGGATLKLTDTAVVGCFSLKSAGGAISADGSEDHPSSVETFNVTFSRNYAENGNGGAVALIGGCTKASFIESHFDSNRCRYDGGAIYAHTNSRLALSDTHLTHNHAGSGGALSLSYGSSATVVRSHFVMNIADDYGGAIRLIELSHALIDSSDFTSNTAGQFGAAIYIATTTNITVVQPSFSENTLPSSADNSLTIEPSGNVVLSSGGAPPLPLHGASVSTANTDHDGVRSCTSAATATSEHYKLRINMHNCISVSSCCEELKKAAATVLPRLPPSYSWVVRSSLGVGLALLAAVAYKIFGKRRRDSTAADAAGLEAAQHSLLTKDAASSCSYLIDHSAVKLESNGVIGSGAEGFVMRGKFNGARVAVKITTLGMNENQRQSVVTEATQEVKLLQQLHHPNIVQLFGLAVKDTSMDTKLMLVMECCVRSLQDHLKDGHNDIQPVEVLGFLLDTCRGMLYLHSHGIIHRVSRLQVNSCSMSIRLLTCA
jgi:predicted outer membrane repeat protein